MRQLALPDKVLYLINCLERCGHEAHAVGGCVRDSLMGLTPADWDLCTAAQPEEMIDCLRRAGVTVLPTGLQHGTVTAVLEGQHFEITSFRADGSYSDHRRPDRVTFVRGLEEDLARRDFTMNAMAYHPARGLTDPFGGQEDLTAGILRCVGDPDRRFTEDALRMLRAARFASVTGFSVEPLTRQSALTHAQDLSKVAPERLIAELNKLLCGTSVVRALREFSALIFVILPELAPAATCPQNNPHHCFDVWEHIIRAVGEAPLDPLLRLTLLLHDVAKPDCRTTDHRGVDHFKKHPEQGAVKADAALRRLRLPNAVRERIVLLIRCHDMRTPPELRAVRQMLARIEEEAFRQLLSVQRADTLAQSLYHRVEKLDRIGSVERLIDEIVREGLCFRLRDLALSGNDLVALGIPAGPEMGAILDHLLQQVMEGLLPNDREVLLREAEILSGGFA